MKRRFESRWNAVLWAVVAATAVLLAWRTHAATTDVVILSAMVAAFLLEIGMNYLVALNILTPERRDAILDPNL